MPSRILLTSSIFLCYHHIIHNQIDLFWQLISEYMRTCFICLGHLTRHLTFALASSTEQSLHHSCLFDVTMLCLINSPIFRKCVNVSFVLVSLTRLLTFNLTQTHCLRLLRSINTLSHPLFCYSTNSTHSFNLSISVLPECFICPGYYSPTFDIQ